MASEIRYPAIISIVADSDGVWSGRILTFGQVLVESVLKVTPSCRSSTQLIRPSFRPLA